jgi:hypothetical protein
VVGWLLASLAFVIALNLSTASRPHDCRMAATLTKVNAIGTAM